MLPQQLFSPVATVAATVLGIEQRIAMWSLMPVDHGESMQVLRYNDGEKYDAHFDYFFDNSSTTNGGNRYATVLAYLSDVEEGGETVSGTGLGCHCGNSVPLVVWCGAARQCMHGITMHGARKTCRSPPARTGLNRWSARMVSLQQ